MEYRKIENSGIPELDEKIIAWVDTSPDREYIQKGSNPSMWMLLDSVPIKPGSYQMFWDVFAEKRKNWVDGDIDIFNDKLKNNTFLPANIKRTFFVGHTRYIVLDICEEMCFILMEGNRPLSDRPNISGGKDGYFWFEDFYEKRRHKKQFRKVFGLTDKEADEFMKKYRSKKS